MEVTLGSGLPGSASSLLLLPLSQQERSGSSVGVKRRGKRNAYLCRKCKQPKKGHICPVEMSTAMDLTETPAVFETFASGMPADHTLDRGFTQIIDNALRVDVQTLFENAVSSFYDSSRFATDSWIGGSLVPEAAPSASSCDRAMFGGTWFEMPITALQSLAGVLREESSTWEGAAAVLARIEDTVSFLERSKASFLEHARQLGATPHASGGPLPDALEVLVASGCQEVRLEEGGLEEGGLELEEGCLEESAAQPPPRLGKRSSTVVLEEAPSTAPPTKRTRRRSRRS